MKAFVHELRFRVLEFSFAIFLSNISPNFLSDPGPDSRKLQLYGRHFTVSPNLERLACFALEVVWSPSKLACISIARAMASLAPSMVMRSAGRVAHGLGLSRVFGSSLRVFRLAPSLTIRPISSLSRCVRYYSFDSSLCRDSPHEIRMLATELLCADCRSRFPSTCNVCSLSRNCSCVRCAGVTAFTTKQVRIFSSSFHITHQCENPQSKLPFSTLSNSFLGGTSA